MGGNVTIQDSLCTVGPDKDGDGWADAGFSCSDGPHYDGFQSDGGNNIKLIHNTIRVPCGQTSAILMSTNTSGIRDVTIQNNLMAGGGYKMGQMIGATDAHGGYAKDNPIHLQRLQSMMYRAVGIDPATTLVNQAGRPMYLLDHREPVAELL